MNMKKCIQINGIKINRQINFFVLYQEIVSEFSFIPLEIFKEREDQFINPEVIGNSGTACIFTSMGHNSREVHYMKIFISILYFAVRIDNERQMKEEFIQMERKYWRDIGKAASIIEERYIERGRSLVKNWNISGYFSKDGINPLHWNIKLGRYKLNSDDFDSYLTRAYGKDLDDSYDKRFIYHASDNHVVINDQIIDICHRMNTYIFGKDDMCNKLQSALKLYYEVIMVYTDMDMSIVHIATILETLLLDKDESCQRKKVAVRTACLLNDGLRKDYKEYWAYYVFYFYKFRNGIVHDGATYLDYEETTINRIVENMKHIIYEIVNVIYTKNIKSIDDIKDIVQKNVIVDGLTEGFDYISPYANEKVYFSYPD